MESRRRPIRLIGHVVLTTASSQKLGAGGMGVVYKAEDTRLHGSVAFKFVSDEASHSIPTRFTRLRARRTAASALNHPNICTIYDIGEEDGRSFIAMEYLDGTTLRIGSPPVR